jgi:hypothetical protein
VVEKMRERWAAQPNAQACEPDVWRIYDCGDEGWLVTVEWLHHDGAIEESRAQAETAPLAICRAALDAVKQYGWEAGNEERNRLLTRDEREQ